MSDAPAGAGVRTMGVVVTYNPGPELTQNLAAVRSQLDDLLVVDNGSSNAAHVEAACAATGCRLLRNGENLGIATALNQAAGQALDAGAQWLATFDQDSLVPADAIAGVLAVWSAHPQRERIGITTMAHRDRNTGGGYGGKEDVIEADATSRVLRNAITSGCLVRCEVFRQAGFFEDRLFIDYVDHEFALRIRRHGWLIVEASKVVMDHSIGAATITPWGRWRIVSFNHNAARRYYMTRNVLEVCSRNLFFEPSWALRGLAGVFWATGLAILLEQDRSAKAIASVRGVCDFLLRRFGRRH